MPRKLLAALLAFLSVLGLWGFALQPGTAAFWALSLCWGLPATLAGAAMALA